MGANKPNTELTSFQLEILQYHQDYAARFGAPPGLRTMARHFRVFPNAIRYHVRILVERGLLLERAVKPVTGRFVLSAKGRSAAG